MKRSTFAHIESLEKGRAALAREPQRLARLKRLQAWQLARLQRTYADLSRNARYRHAVEFFAQHLYGPRDFSQRTRLVRKMLGVFERVLSRRALNSIRTALELEALSQNLDLAVVAALDATKLTEASYANAYRAAGRRRDREHQIELLITAGRMLDELTRQAWIPQALKLARIPARLAGVQTLHEFLERGYTAFIRMGGASELLDIIEHRERLIMNNLFAGALHPFDVSSRRKHRKSCDHQ